MIKCYCDFYLFFLLFSFFSDMGQVTKETFDVSTGSVSFTLNVEYTEGIKEFWIIDFEPYRYNVDQLPVNEATGQWWRNVEEGEGRGGDLNI